MRPPRMPSVSTTTGSAGEARLTRGTRRPRPTGIGLKNLLEALAEIGFPGIHPTAFDAVDIPKAAEEAGFSFDVMPAVRRWCSEFILIEIKTCTQERVDGGFGRFMFSFPAREMAAAEILGDRYRVVLHNRRTGQTREASVPELLGQASSKVWQLSIQLAPTDVVWDGPDVFDLFEHAGESDVLDFFSGPTPPVSAPVKPQDDIFTLFAKPG